MVVGLVPAPAGHDAENKQPLHFRLLQDDQQGQQVHSATIPVQQPQHLVDAKILYQYNLVLRPEFGITVPTCATTAGAVNPELTALVAKIG